MQQKGWGKHHPSPYNLLGKMRGDSKGGSSSVATTKNLSKTTLLPGWFYRFYNLIFHNNYYGKIGITKK